MDRGPHRLPSPHPSLRPLRPLLLARSLLARSLLAWSLLGLVGCSGPAVQRLTAPPARLPALRLVVVYPVALRWPGASAEEHYRKTVDLLEVLGAGPVALLGPDEFLLRHPASDELSSASNALYTAKTLGFAAAEVGLVRVWVEQRLQRGVQQTYDAVGRPRGAVATEQALYLVHGELWQMLPTRLLAAYQFPIEHDPFAESPECDPRPEVRLGVQRVGRELAELLVRAAPRAPRAVEPGFSFFANQAGVVDHRLAGQPTLAEEVSRLDALERELRIWRAFEYFRPGIDSRGAAQLFGQAPGLIVTRVEARGRRAGLQVGDRVFAVGEQAVAHGYQLRRELARQAGPLLLVERGGQTLRLPWR